MKEEGNEAHTEGAVSLSHFIDRVNCLANIRCCASLFRPRSDLIRIMEIAPASCLSKSTALPPAGTVTVAVSSDRYMPFSEGARIEIENEGPEACELQADIRYSPLPESHAENLLRFHAKWHRDQYLDLDAERFQEEGDRWPDWPLLLKKGRGRFCGWYQERGISDAYRPVTLNERLDHLKLGEEGR
ncbi:DUF2961 domain-containing protein [uncultured Paenibacillus sp.]|uniref:DUF2961 domain-containing protein n=1 Tax=uncultured Paenibacillus sp. TaxID=227322 RepID=UPI002804C8FF|nr:DUF2961 domain-containing protein [uncultured Paenibacillus sp.]